MIYFTLGTLFEELWKIRRKKVWKNILLIVY
jgi:hypothetical protein